MDQMNMGKAYVGCLARTSDGHYTLTDASVAGKKPEMAMGKDDMGMAKDTMASQAMGAMNKDAMMPLTLGLTSEKVDLGKHVGHQVSVAGTDAQPMGKMAMFTVTSLTMVANTCAKGAAGSGWPGGARGRRAAKMSTATWAAVPLGW
jgi:hypothetical protein